MSRDDERLRDLERRAASGNEEAGLELAREREYRDGFAASLEAAVQDLVGKAVAEQDRRFGAAIEGDDGKWALKGFVEAVRVAPRMLGLVPERTFYAFVPGGSGTGSGFKSQHALARVGAWSILLAWDPAGRFRVDDDQGLLWAVRASAVAAPGDGRIAVALEAGTPTSGLPLAIQRSWTRGALASLDRGRRGGAVREDEFLRTARAYLDWVRMPRPRVERRGSWGSSDLDAVRQFSAPLEVAARWLALRRAGDLGVPGDDDPGGGP